MASWARPSVKKFTYPASFELGFRQYGINLSSTDFAICIEPYSLQVGISIVVREGSAQREYYFVPSDMNNLHMTINDNEGIHLHWTAKRPPLATGWPVEAFHTKFEQRNFVNDIGQCRFFNIFTSSTNRELVDHLKAHLYPFATSINGQGPPNSAPKSQKDVPTGTDSQASISSQRSSTEGADEQNARMPNGAVNIKLPQGQGLTSSLSSFGKYSELGKSDKSPFALIQKSTGRKALSPAKASASLKRGADEALLGAEDTSRKKARSEAAEKSTPDACTVSQTEDTGSRGTMVPFFREPSVMPEITDEVADTVLLELYTAQGDVSYWMGLKGCNTVNDFFEKVVTAMNVELVDTSIARLLVKTEEDDTLRAICLVPGNTAAFRALQNRVVRMMDVHGHCTLLGEVTVAQK